MWTEFWFLSLLLFYAVVDAATQCPPNSLSLEINDTVCYSFHSKPIKYFAADIHCKSFGAQLVSLKTEYINVFIDGYAGLIFEDYIFFWSGGNSLQKDSQEFFWGNGEKIEYSHFSGKEKPKNGSCLSADVRQGFWKVENCFAELSFVCEFLAGKGIIPDGAVPLNITLLHPTPPSHPTDATLEPSSTTFPEETTTEIPIPLTCPSSYQLHQKNCYKFSEEPKSWNDAESECQKEGGHLASIHSEEENYHIATAFPKDSNATKNCAAFTEHNQIWIGYNNISHPYAWSDGSATDFINWCASEPNNLRHAESCGTIVLVCHGRCRLHWNDFRCDRKLRFACKQPARESGSPATPSDATATTEIPMTAAPDHVAFSSTTPSSKTETDSTEIPTSSSIPTTEVPSTSSSSITSTTTIVEESTTTKDVCTFNNSSQMKILPKGLREYDAPTLDIERASKPTQHYIESYSPIHFRVTFKHGTHCKGVPNAQFALIGLFGENQGINIMPKWNDPPTTFTLGIYAASRSGGTTLLVSPPPVLKYCENLMMYDVIISPRSEITISTLIDTEMQNHSMDSYKLPDFFDGKYQALMFFQPFQTGDGPEKELNQCQFELQYNGKLTWNPPVGSG